MSVGGAEGTQSGVVMACVLVWDPADVSPVTDGVPRAASTLITSAAPALLKPPLRGTSHLHATLR